MDEQLKELFENAVRKFNQPKFIKDDPISIPHAYQKKQDIEITAFWSAMLAWGRRPTIIAKARELFDLMGSSPHDFILNHGESDRARFLVFKHRTFQPTDTLYFLEFLQWFYRQFETLEEAFLSEPSSTQHHVGPHLESFHRVFFSLPEAPLRTRKHVPAPLMNSACKKLNLFLRWMVRDDGAGVDFGIWKKIKPSQLLIPLDVHVERVAKKYGLLSRKQPDWQAVLELTARLREMDPLDPVKYDYALFGLGVLQKHRVLD